MMHRNRAYQSWLAPGADPGILERGNGHRANFRRNHNFVLVILTFGFNPRDLHYRGYLIIMVVVVVVIVVVVVVLVVVVVVGLVVVVPGRLVIKLIAS